MNEKEGLPAVEIQCCLPCGCKAILWHAALINHVKTNVLMSSYFIDGLKQNIVLGYRENESLKVWASIINGNISLGLGVF
jgi:hypothetical protein